MTMKKIRIIKYWICLLCIPLSISGVWGQKNAEDFIEKMEKTYSATKTLSFDGNVKYYTQINSESPSEVMMISYRRDGDKVHITIGNQIVVYDGGVNIIINEDEKRIYLSNKKPPSGKKYLPMGLSSQYLKSGFFNAKLEDYMGDKTRITLTEKDKSVASVIAFVAQKKTYFLEFARMIIDKEDEEVNPDINKKKFEYSYYNYKTTLSEKIDANVYISKVKQGSKMVYKGIGRFKDFEIVQI